MELDEIRNFWKKALGVHGPQWMIMTALQRLDRGKGVSAGDIADLLQMAPVFVTAHARRLEAKGFVRLTVLSAERGDVILSPTDKAREQFAKLGSP